MHLTKRRIVQFLTQTYIFWASTFDREKFSSVQRVIFYKIGNKIKLQVPKTEEINFPIRPIWLWCFIKVEYQNTI